MLKFADLSSQLKSTKHPTRLGLRATRRGQQQFSKAFLCSGYIQPCQLQLFFRILFAD